MLHPYVSVTPAFSWWSGIKRSTLHSNSVIIYPCSDIIQEKRQEINVEILNFYNKSILMSWNPQKSLKSWSAIEYRLIYIYNALYKFVQYQFCWNIYEMCSNVTLINPFQYSKIPILTQILISNRIQSLSTYIWCTLQICSILIKMKYIIRNRQQCYNNKSISISQNLKKSLKSWSGIDLYMSNALYKFVP